MLTPSVSDENLTRDSTAQDNGILISLGGAKFIKPEGLLDRDK